MQARVFNKTQYINHPETGSPLLSEAIRQTTDEYIESISGGMSLAPSIMMRGLLSKTIEAIEEHNRECSREDRWAKPKELYPSQIAMLLVATRHACLLSLCGEGSDTGHDDLALYCSSGKNKGTYVLSSDYLSEVIREFSFLISDRGKKEVVGALRDIAPRRTRSTNPDLVAVNNGIFNYATKELLPFSPEEVFISKSRVDYVANAPNPIIRNPIDGSDWDAESWMSELSDDPEVVNVLWEIIGAIIRPNVSWNKTAWFYSEEGNNGKGTLCALMRNICGEGAYASIPISELGGEFKLEPLLRASAIIVDENDVGGYVDRAANLKAIITGDVVSINRKHKTPIHFRFSGFMVQCLNSRPKVKDRSESFYRRLLLIPFEKCFTGAERKYIKDDYLARPEVLQYVLYRVMNMSNYELTIPRQCENLLNEYKEFNDLVRVFYAEIVSQMVWDLLPFTFLHDTYVAWLRRYSPSSTPLGRNQFIHEIISHATKSGEWKCDRKKTVYSVSRMEGPEPLICEYEVKNWYNKEYSGSNADKISTPILASSYRGLERTQ